MHKNNDKSFYKNLYIYSIFNMIVLLSIVFPIVFDISRLPIQTWDEARQAINAQEMLASGNWLITTYDNQPDLWNTKPLLLIWLQAASIALLGPTELAVRLPSLAAAAATVLLVYGVCARRLHSLAAGLVAGFVLVTARGFVRPHVARTGDFDALLTFWVLLSVICFFLYLETDRRRWLLGWGVALAAGMLTKGVAALLGSPALLLYVLSQRKLLPLLRRPLVWGVVLGAFAAPITYYAVRNAVQPGYWQAVQVNELGGRFGTVLDNHVHPWYYFLELLRDEYFTPWHLVLPPALLALLLWQRHTETGRFALLLLLYVGCWLVVISIGKTKLSWYEAPTYPLLALLIGLGIATAWQRLTGGLPQRLALLNAAGLALLLLAVALPYKRIIDDTITERGNEYSWGPETAPATALRRYLRLQPNLHSLALVYEGSYAAGLLFYQRAMQERGVPTSIVNLDIPSDLEVNTQVITCSPEARAAVETRYRTEVLHSDGPCQVLLLLGGQ